MRIEKQYRELLRIKEEVNQRIKKGTDFQKIKELMLYLAQEKNYFKLKCTDNMYADDQLIKLDFLLNIWLEEKKKLPELGIETDIFYKISSLGDVEHKYLKVLYCGLRIENHVPDEYCEQAIEQMIEDRVSGIAIGKIIVFETKKREENLLYIARFLRRKGEVLNALFLMQYANETFPGNEKLLLEEADIWLEGRQWKKAMEILSKVKNPSRYVKEMETELRRVIKYG